MAEFMTDRGLAHQKNMQITCMVVYEDETAGTIAVHSLSMRGAEREVTGYLIGEGYSPVGRWVTRDTEGDEVVRRFVSARHPRPRPNRAATRR